MFSMRQSRNILFIVLGAVLVIAAVLANLFIARTFRPPTYEVVAAKTDIAAGEPIIPANLTILTITDVSKEELGKYILKDEAPAFFGLRVRANVRAGDLILRENLALDLTSDDAILAKFLNNPENVFLILTSARDKLPNFISPGDTVNIFLAFGSSFSGQSLFENTSKATPTPSTQQFIFLLTPPSPAETPTPPAEGEGTTEPEVVQEAATTPTPTPFPEIFFPAVQPLLENVPIASVSRDGEGRISGIGIIVPRKFQSMLILADRANALHFTLSGPTARPFTSTVPLRPFSYNDLADLFRFQLEEASRRGELISFTLFSTYIERYYPDLADSIRSTQEAWLAREKKPGNEEMDEIIRGRP